MKCVRCKRSEAEECRSCRLLATAFATGVERSELLLYVVIIKDITSLTFRDEDSQIAWLVKDRPAHKVLQNHLRGDNYA